MDGDDGEALIRQHISGPPSILSTDTQVENLIFAIFLAFISSHTKNLTT